MTQKLVKIQITQVFESDDNKAFDSPIMKNQYALSIISNLLIIAINLYQYNEFDLNSNKIESNYGKFW